MWARVIPSASEIPDFLADQHSSLTEATEDCEAAIEGLGVVKMWTRTCYADSVYKSYGQSFQAGS